MWRRIIGIGKSLRDVGFAATVWECVLAVVPYSVLRPLFTRSEAAYRAYIARRNQRQRVVPAAPVTARRIVLYIGQLGPGGSERQLCNLARGLHAKGHIVTVLSASRLDGKNAHYVPALQADGIPVRGVMRGISDHGARWGDIPDTPLFARSYVYCLSNELRQLQPDVLHCWLDYTNIVGGMAGIVSDVGRIVLSGRSLNPTHFPALVRPWMKTWYQILLSDNRTIITNNSHAGADDYAQWLGIPSERIAVVYNGLPDAPRARERETGATLKASLGIRKDAPLLGGVFRLSEEKCPLDFLRVFHEVRERITDVVAILVGDGPLAGAVDRAIRELNLGDAVKRLPRVTDTDTIMAACDVILLTSRMEGTPNVLMEAQCAGVPVVATRVGGVCETVSPPGRRHLCEIHDIKGMAAHVVTLLQNDEMRAQEGREARAWAETTFSIDRMVAEYEQIYERGSLS